MRHYDEIARFEREGFEIVVDKTWEDLHLRDFFDESVTDLKQLCEDIDSYKYEWFMLRVRALFNGHELGCSYLRGCLYEDAKDVLTDGTVEDQLITVLGEARAEAQRLAGLLTALLDDKGMVPV
jgi:hypothetical protein